MSLCIKALMKKKFISNRRNAMEYKKPEIVAQNASTGLYAAGCPTNERCGVWGGGKECERAD